jgi:hypothetical protein
MEGQRNEMDVSVTLPTKRARQLRALRRPQRSMYLHSGRLRIAWEGVRKMVEALDLA